MPAYVCLLRGVNVTGYRKVDMKELKGLFEALGHTDVTTYIQSGNVVFMARKQSPDGLARAIRPLRLLQESSRRRRTNSRGKRWSR